MKRSENANSAKNTESRTRWLETTTFYCTVNRNRREILTKWMFQYSATSRGGSRDSVDVGGGGGGAQLWSNIFNN